MPSQARATATAQVALGLCLAPLAAFSPVLASERIDPAAYPELAPDAQLPAILAELRHTLPDIYSVREMRICPASRIKLKDGKPNDWAVRFEYNAKNQSGGYAGIQRDVAIFRNRRIAYPIGGEPQLGRSGLDGVLGRTVDRQMEACTAVPDATIQQVLAAPR